MKRLVLIFLIMLINVELPSCSDMENNISIPEDDETFHFNPTSEYIAVFGDIQYLTDSQHISIFKNSVDWLDNMFQQGMKINCVLHTGDVTMKNDQSSYELFYDATRDIAKKIGFYSMIGDHDYTWNGIYIDDRSSTLFNDYVVFPTTLNRLVAWYEPWHMENVVIENFIHGHRYDLLILEFGPRTEVVEWADRYVKSHPNTNFILMNHEYLEVGGGRRTTGLKCTSRLRNTTYTTPEQLWNKLIKCNDNIRIVLCGHVGGLYNVTKDVNDFGNEVAQIQHNIQSPDFRFDNWLMLWEFPENKDYANVFIVNTKTSKYYSDSECLFQFSFHYSSKDSIKGLTAIKQKCGSNIYSIQGTNVNKHYKGIIIKNAKKHFFHK